MSGGWHGVDLDGTLALYPPRKGEVIGRPIRLMRLRVVRWLAKDEGVKILTARKLTPEFLSALDRWCIRHVGQKLEATNSKDLSMIDLWDDVAVQVEPNTGRRVDGKD